MKRTTAQTQMPTYEASGKELTIYWDEQTQTNSEGETVYSYAYCVINIYADRSQIIERVMGCMYPTYGSEMAAIINGGADAAAHDAARTNAKALADGWLVNV